MPDHDADPQVVPYLLYEDAGAAMDWLISVFGFTERVRDRQSDGTVRRACAVGRRRRIRDLDPGGPRAQLYRR